MQIPVPPDLGEMKDTVVFGLTKKQILFFAIGAIIGVPVFFLTLDLIGSSNAALLMLICMFPFFYLAMYHKNGYGADKIMIYKINHRNANTVRRYVSVEQKLNNENNKRKEVERLEKEIGGTVVFKICKGLYQIKKAYRAIWKKVSEYADKKPYK